MNEKKPVLFALSREEVMVVLGYIKGNGILGLERNEFKDLSKHEIQLVMGATERSLIARGFVHPSGDKLVLNELVESVVGVCPFPEVSWAVLHQNAEPPTEQYYFHALKQLFILHGIPMSGIHQFLSLPGRQAGLKSLLSILRLQNAAIDSECESGRVSRKTMEEAQQAATKKDYGLVEKVLIKDGLAARTASMLSQSLIDRKAYSSLVRIEQKTESENGKGIAILQSPGKLWLLSSQIEGKNSWTFIESANEDKIINRIKVLFD